MTKTTELFAGLDIGSTTLKWWITDTARAERLKIYRRHHADIGGELFRSLDEIEAEIADQPFELAITGSGGMAVAEHLGVPFVQEVIAGTDAALTLYPDTDAIVELGGEDAKITFLKPSLDQRMNGTCAGGTGAFIDQMASLLMTDAAGLDRLASKAKKIYPIASRCGVFAKSDLQPLINDGVAQPDLAASVFQAVVNQTISGLACGQPLTGNLVFLGGPLYFLPQLVEAFRRTLEGQISSIIVPENAHFFVAKGAASHTDGTEVTIQSLRMRLGSFQTINREPPLPRLFENDADKAAFDKRHDIQPAKSQGEPKAPYYIGFDAGSTTTKAVAVDSLGDVVFTDYRKNDGKPVETALDITRCFYDLFGADVEVGGSRSTGYGEELIKAALELDQGVVETMAHYRGARQFEPDVDFILDIGGQDMKALHISDGAVDSIIVNEACSSGCGSFLQTFASGLGMSIEEFAEAAVSAKEPVDLGTRCTVFMNSKVKQAQKEGSDVSDISAGLAYSVVRNALYKVIKVKDAADLGSHIVCQGGTFLNDAVLRAFELLLGRNVVRPPMAGLMGAYGAALLARDGGASLGRSLLSQDELNNFTQTRKSAHCGRCPNSCLLTISTFSGGRRHITGHRCERGIGAASAGSAKPNLFAYKNERVFAYQPKKDAPLGRIGVPRVLNLYENYPFWFTFLDALGFDVQLSDPSTEALFAKGLDSIPSESVCFPAKLVHGHIENLVEKGIKTIFYPDVVIEDETIEGADKTFNCPIVVSYPEVARTNIASLEKHDISFLNPFLNLKDLGSTAVQLEATFAPFGVSKSDVDQAVALAEAEQNRYLDDIRRAGDDALLQMAVEGLEGVVLAGRPYHVDPGIHHGIPELINQLGYAVLSEDSVSHLAEVPRPLRVVDQWAYHSRLYAAAAFVAGRDDLELVQLNSFGCGLDAITTDQVGDLLSAAGKLQTTLKIDEISNLGAARIRLRSLFVAKEARRSIERKRSVRPYQAVKVQFTKPMKKTHTLLAPQMSPIHFRLLQTVFRNEDYDMVVLERVSPEDIETGLKYVNNDACYPTILVVGQLMNALLSGEYDPETTALMLTQTGGGCRATNYVAFLRKALADGGFPDVPVIALSVSGIETNPGFRYTPKLLHRALQAIVAGDVMQTVLLRTRPYELTPGDVTKRYEEWNRRFDDYFLDTGDQSFRKLLQGMVHEFDTMPLNGEKRRPRVGIVGEILLKFHPDANRHAVGVIESEGFEAAMPGLLDFFLYCFHNQQFVKDALGGSRLTAAIASLGVRLIERYRKTANELLKNSERFQAAEHIEKVAKRAETILSLGNHSGEGWLLTGEMLELIEHGVPNILVCQPFACLPNHVVGKGMIRAVRRKHPEANIVAVDYDPGASEVNQLNRIRLMLARAGGRLAVGSDQIEKAAGPVKCAHGR